jgi:hypothetical protein
MMLRFLFLLLDTHLLTNGRFFGFMEFLRL